MEKGGRKREGRDTVNECYFLNDPVSPQEEENMKGKAKMNKLRCEITYCIICPSPEQLIGCIHLECYDQVHVSRYRSRTPHDATGASRQ